MIKDRNIDPNAQIQISKIQGAGGLGMLLSGAPRPGSQIAGQVYYVNEEHGSDDNDGLAPDRPYATILKARTVQAARISWAGDPWSNNDMIIVYPGVYAETALTGGLYGVSLIGLGNAFDVDGEAGVTIKSTAAAWDATSWINGACRNVCFHGSSDSSTEALLTLDNCNRFQIEDCVFQGVPGASPSTLYGFQINKDMTGSQMRRCWFNQCVDSIYLVADNANSKQITGDLFEDLYIMACSSDAIYCDANAVPSGTVFNRFVIGPTPAYGIRDASSTIMFAQGWIECTSMSPASASGHYSQVYVNGTLYT